MMHQKAHFALAPCVALLLGVLWAAPVAQAIESDGLLLFPTFGAAEDDVASSWFIETLSPGKQQIEFVTIGNAGSETVEMYLYPADALTTEDGAFALANRGASMKGIGSWIRMAAAPISMDGFSANEQKQLAISSESSKLTTREDVDVSSIPWLPYGEPIRIAIPPQGRTVIPFEIQVPDLQEVSDYAGGIVAEDTKKEEHGSIAIVKRVGVRMYLMIPGERVTKFSHSDFELRNRFSTIAVKTKLTNEGNVRIEPRLILKKRNLITGHTELLSAPSAATVLPGSSITLEGAWYKDGWGVFQYEALLSVPPTKRESADSSETPGELLSMGYFVSPNLVIVFGLFFLVAFAGGFVHIFRAIRVPVHPRKNRGVKLKRKVR